jgi:hypothetical protein
MTLPHAGADVRLTLNKGCEDESEWVRSDVWEAMERAAFDMRRTLAVAHMFMSFGDWPRARLLIERDTGLTLDDAHVMRGLFEEFGPNSESRIPPGKDAER